MQGIGAILRLVGQLVLPVMFVIGLYLVAAGVGDKRDTLAIAGAIMLGSLAIAGQISASKE